MNKIKLIIIFTAVISLQGCGAMFAKMASSNLPSSKYNAIPIIESDVETYYSVLEKINSKGEVVSDELGNYFIKKEKAGTYSKFTLLKEDGSALKNALTSSVGLMEPVYSYQKDMTWKLNWKETKRKHRFFSRKVGLKLLPLKYTRKYHDYVLKGALGKMEKHRSGGIFTSSMNKLSSATSGEYGLYNPQYFAQILSKVSNKAEYLISYRPVASFYMAEFSKQANNISHLDKSKMTPEARKAYERAQENKPGAKNAISYNMMAASLAGYDFSAINFIPVSYFKNLKSGGDYRIYSGCQVESRENRMEQIKQMNELTAIPYASALTAVVKSKDKDNIKLAQSKFNKAIKAESNMQRLTESACRKGYRAMGLSGVIKSKKLR